MASGNFDRGVIFKIERIDIPETPDEEEWLAKQSFTNSADNAYTGIHKEGDKNGKNL